MTILGFIGISYSSAVTMASVAFIGFILAASGVGHVVHSFWVRQWKGVFVSLILGILSIILGAICFFKPIESAASITLLLGAFCLTVGIFRMLTTAFMRFERWGWVFFNGLVTFLLGLLIISQWPISGLWVIGLFVGIEVFMSGISLILLSMVTRR
jgi:uncharacterized membrane protein HdeD (DUF308 family)